VALAGQGDAKGAVLCGDGTLRIRDGSAHWKTAVKKSDVVALNADDNRFVMVEQMAQCPGLLTRWFSVRDNHLNSAKKGHCFKIPVSDPNDISVSNRGSTVWLWSRHVIKTG